MEIVEVIIKNPKSGFNSFKRILALLLGFFLLFIFLMALKQRIDDTFDLVYLGSMTLFMSGIFIYYGVFRSKIHKKYYLKFWPDRIEGRFKSAQIKNNGSYGLGDLYELLLNPSYDEINTSIRNFKEIDVNLDTIILTEKKGGKIIIPLHYVDYLEMKQIKSNFLKYKELLKND